MNGACIIGSVSSVELSQDRQQILFGVHVEPEYAHLVNSSSRFWNASGITLKGSLSGIEVMERMVAKRPDVPIIFLSARRELDDRIRGLGAGGTPSAKLDARLAQLGIPAPAFAASPTLFWDLFAEQGHPVRATVSDLGPLLLARMLNLNDTQQGVLQLVFKIADDKGLLLIDLKDLRASIQYVGEKEAQCIAVDHPRHLYVTDNHIVTHNTFTGLGVVKRFVKQGKNNVLILAPSQGILDGWVASGRMIGLDITRLPDTGTAGSSGGALPQADGVQSASGADTQATPAPPSGWRSPRPPS